MKSRYYLLGFFSLVLCSVQAQKGFSLKDVLSKKKVEVLYDGKLLTAYCYFDSTEKPVLFPIKTLSAVTERRGFPILPPRARPRNNPTTSGWRLTFESVMESALW